jgi:hypothetical protein
MRRGSTLSMPGVGSNDIAAGNAKEVSARLFLLRIARSLNKPWNCASSDYIGAEGCIKDACAGV